MRMRGDNQAHGGGAGGELLLPFRNFHMRPARLTTAITSGARVEPLALEFDLLGLGVGVVGAKRRGDRLAGRKPRLALEHNEAPRRELAVIGHARGDGEQRVDLGRDGPGPESSIGLTERRVLRSSRASGMAQSRKPAAPSTAHQS